ncbi:Tryptophan synthase alpha chain [Dirofilaria immitis]
MNFTYCCAIRKTAIVLLMSNVGQVVTLNLKNGKCVQGRIKSVNANKRTVLLERPFLNGKPMGEREKIFQINSIHSFRILNTEAETPNKKAISEKTIESTTTHDDAVAVCAASDCPSKTTKHEEAVHQVNSKKKQVEEITNACKNIAITDTTAVRELNVHQQQQSPCSSPSGSSCPSPMVKPLSKLRHGHGTRISNGKNVSSINGESKSLPVVAVPIHKGRRNRGPNIISESDATVQHNRDKKTNEGLIKPIDFDLNEDFDFEKNLEIFRNYEKNANISEQKEMSAVGTLFAQKNYEHFENVISDPSRVTSWTTKTHDQFVATRLETTVDGQLIPLLKPCDKEKFLQRAEPYLGSDMFHVLIADRLMMFIWRIIDKFEIMVSQIVVLDSAAVNTFLTTMFLRHISNRACQTVVYSCLLGQYNLPHVLQVHNVQELPKDGIELVVVLGPLLLESVKEWIKNLGSSIHLVCIEKVPELVKNEHVLMVGVGTDHDGCLKQKNSDNLCCVADIGIPFAWMDADSATSLSSAFSTQNIVLY